MISVSLIQHNIDWENKEFNLNFYRSQIEKIEKTDLIILPAMFTTGFTMDPKPFAESMDGMTINWMKENAQFTGELFLGHLRYGTFGKNSIENIHPFVRENNWMSRNLVVAGNFNLTNVDELFNKLVRWHILQ